MHSIKIVIFSAMMTAFSTQAFAASDGHAHHHHDMKTPLSEVGKPANASQANKVIHVDLLDSMKFEFKERMTIKQGDIVKFIVTNQGEIDHEFSVGSEEEQKAHLEMMKQMPDMVHNDGTTITVKPRETKVLTWQFTKKAEVMFACNIPAHFEAGMHHKMLIK